jgi:hypothetical protein
MYFLGGVQLLALGVIGEYLGKLYVETKSRPRFFIEQVLGDSHAGLDGSSQEARAMTSNLGEG